MWLCICGLINSGLNDKCAASTSWKHREHYQITVNQPDFLQFTITAREDLIVTPQEELFARFYNHEKLFVKDLDDDKLREHRDELASIAFNAKARLVAIDDEGKERKAKSGAGKEWTVTPLEADQTSTDSINAVKIRKDRMSKMDKIRQGLVTAGLDEDTINEMIRNMERKATEKSLKTVTFQKAVVETAAVVVQAKSETESKVEFNPSSLFGK